MEAKAHLVVVFAKVSLNVRNAWTSTHLDDLQAVLDHHVELLFMPIPMIGFTLYDKVKDLL